MGHLPIYPGSVREGPEQSSFLLGRADAGERLASAGIEFASPMSSLLGGLNFRSRRTAKSRRAFDRASADYRCLPARLGDALRGAAGDVGQGNWGLGRRGGRGNRVRRRLKDCSSAAVVTLHNTCYRTLHGSSYEERPFWPVRAKAQRASRLSAALKRRFSTRSFHRIPFMRSGVLEEVKRNQEPIDLFPTERATRPS
jgi:hypothetical protein